jgi:hypothetical protein
MFHVHLFGLTEMKCYVCMYVCMYTTQAKPNDCSVSLDELQGGYVCAGIKTTCLSFQFG